MHFRTALKREYEEKADKTMEIFTPANNEEIVLNFRGEKMAKVRNYYHLYDFLLSNYIK